MLQHWCNSSWVSQEGAPVRPSEPSSPETACVPPSCPLGPPCPLALHLQLPPLILSALVLIPLYSSPAWEVRHSRCQFELSFILFSFFLIFFFFVKLPSTIYE